MQGSWQLPQGCATFLLIDPHWHEFPLSSVTLKQSNSLYWKIFTRVSLNSDSDVPLRPQKLCLFSLYLPWKAQPSWRNYWDSYSPFIPWCITATNGELIAEHLAAHSRMGNTALTIAPAPAEIHLSPKLTGRFCQRHSGCSRTPALKHILPGQGWVGVSLSILL